VKTSPPLGLGDSYHPLDLKLEVLEPP